MNNRLKILSILTFFAIFIWNRYGNFKAVISEYGMVIVSVLCILSLVLVLLQSLKQSQHRALLIIIFLLLLLIPCLFLSGNKLGFPPRFITIYSVGVISLLIIFRKEIGRLVNSKVQTPK